MKHLNLHFLFKDDFSMTYYPNVTISRDANPRFTFFTAGYINNSIPGKLRKYLVKAKEHVDKNQIEPEIITINAWNEWSEGACLEPDTICEYQYPDAGVDFLVLDATNNIVYEKQSESLMKAIKSLQDQGYNPPKNCLLYQYSIGELHAKRISKYSVMNNFSVTPSISFLLLGLSILINIPIVKKTGDIYTGMRKNRCNTPLI
ncbi:MAG: glycoside hydrolase family 99-like domain-containing protein [Tannerella sp.]|jgi:hypothetical protein|nr:glycoside hydrolase family 99-like domain-containing protein [Tannerella sp.]